MLLNDNKLEFDKVVSKIGFPITFEDYRSTYKYDANIDKITEFEFELRNNMGKGYNTVLDIKDRMNEKMWLFTPLEKRETVLEEIIAGGFNTKIKVFRCSNGTW